MIDQLAILQLANLETESSQNVNEGKLLAEPPASVLHQEYFASVFPEVKSEATSCGCQTAYSRWEKATFHC